MNTKLLNVYYQILKQRHVGLSIAKQFELGLLHRNVVVGHYTLEIPEKFINKSGIIFPIKDLYNKVVSIYFRRLDNSMPKYDSIPFSKQYILYGMFYTWPFILESNSCILVEGPFDLLTLLSYGIKNVCCSLGTSMTFYQACLLRRFTTRCHIIYDGDSIGKFQAQKVSQILKDVGIETKIIFLPLNLDPDQFLIKFGKDEFLKLL